MDYDDSRLRRLLGKLFLQQRKRKGHSQDSVCQNIHIKTETLRNIEKGITSARLAYLCQLFLELFDFDLEAFIINNYLNPPGVNDYKSAAWKKQAFISLCYRQVNHNQIYHLIFDQLKQHQSNQPDKPQQQLNFTRGNQMERRTTLFGLSSAIISGPALTDSLQGWLEPFDKTTTIGQSNLVQKIGKLNTEDINALEQAAFNLYQQRMRYGGGPNRKIAIALLHEISVALKEGQTKAIATQLFPIMASLADTTAKMAWHDGLELDAQNYYQLALRASHAAHDRLFGARVLYGMAWQMCHLNKPNDALNLVNFALSHTENIAGPQLKARLYMHKAWAYASQGNESDFKRTIELSEDYIAQAKYGEEPYWISHSDASALAGMSGGGLRKLAVHKPKLYAEQASEANTEAINLRKQVIHTTTAQDYLGLAESRFLLNDTELAVSATNKALHIYAKLQNRCGATQRRLHVIYQYTQQKNKARSLQALNTKLKSLLAIA